ncbi:MAG: ATP-dependent Clp protease adapter ClpS [Gleimia sp.]|jgi:ATP-dependent Clp protease adaptor protein ClpS
MATTPLTKQRPSAQSAPGVSKHAQWSTVVWDDPVNTMAYVTQVFRRHFGYGLERASSLMLKVHNNGKAVVSTGPKERMEADVYAMHSYGLKATLEPVEST